MVQISGINIIPAPKLVIAGVNIIIDKPNLIIYVVDDAGLPVENVTIDITSSIHTLQAISDSDGIATTRFVAGIDNTILATASGYADSTTIISPVSSSVLSIYIVMQPSELRLKVVNRNHEPIEGATCRVLNAISGSNNVLSFDGVDDYVGFGNSTNIQNWFAADNFSFEIYFKSSTTASTKCIFSKYAGASGYNIGYLNWPSTGKVSFFQGGGSSYFTSVRSGLNDGEWHHVAFQRAGTTILIIIDGVLDSSRTRVAGTVTNGDFYIGREFGQATRFFAGQTADARLYNFARSAAQIQADINKRLIGTETGLNGYWKLDEGEGAVATDLAGSNNGTIYGATWAEADESFPIPGDFIGQFDTATPYDSQTTNANGLTTLNYQINTIHGLEVTLPGKRRFIMPFERTERGLLDWQVMLSDYLATFATDRGNILINSEPENNDANFLIE